MYSLNRSINEIALSFNSQIWHDSKFIGFSVSPAAELFDVFLTLRMRTGKKSDPWIDTTAMFEKTRIVVADMDLLGIQLCGGDISDAECFTDPVRVEREVRDEIRNFDLDRGGTELVGKLAFQITFIPPGGQLVIFADDVHFAPGSTAPADNER